MADRWRYRSRGPRIGGGARAVAFAALLVGTFFVFTHRSQEAREATEPGRTALDDFIVGVGKRFTVESGNSQSTIAALEAEVRELSRWRLEAAAQAERLRTLEALVSMREEPMPLGIVARTVIESAGPFERSRLANAGFDQGVREDFAAVNEHGLVGRILHVGSRSSRILLVSDFNSRIPVMSEITGNRALMRGDGGSTMVLENIDSIADLTEGERWLTSGEDGRLMRGIPVGVAFQDARQRWRLVPLASKGSEDFVRILPAPDIELPEPIGPFAPRGALAEAAADPTLTTTPPVPRPPPTRSTDTSAARTTTGARPSETSGLQAPQPDSAGDATVRSLGAPLSSAPATLQEVSPATSGPPAPAVQQEPVLPPNPLPSDPVAEPSGQPG